MRVLFKSNNLIGDALNISPAWRTWIKKQGLNSLQDEIIMQTLPDHVAPLYQGMVRDLVKIQTFFNRLEGTFDFEFNFDVNKAFIISDQDKCHIAESYAKMLGVELTGGIERLKPTYIPEIFAMNPTLDNVLYQEELKGMILISMFSASCESRDKNTPGLPPNKCLPFFKWKPVLQLIQNEYPDTPIRFLGAPTDIVPDILKEFGEQMFGIPLNRLALIMQKAKLLVTIDNGMAHLGASQETPMFEMYPRCLAQHYILPKGNPNLEFVQMDPVHVSPAQLVFTLGKAIQRFKAKEVSGDKVE
jgi:ADP-heptose:LPS heptosyltransferase